MPRRVTPRRVMVWFCVFFVVYALVAFAMDHPTYAVYSAALAVVWFALALYWRDNERPS